VENIVQIERKLGRALHFFLVRRAGKCSSPIGRFVMGVGKGHWISRTNLDRRIAVAMGVLPLLMTEEASKVGGIRDL
jgi:hypothetical protein